MAWQSPSVQARVGVCVAPRQQLEAELAELAQPILAEAGLELVELAPFRALANELPTLMTAHILFESLDGVHPATLSKNIVDGLLRKKLGYTGLVFSDDMEMKAVAELHGIGDAACLAIAAG